MCVVGLERLVGLAGLVGLVGLVCVVGIVDLVVWLVWWSGWFVGCGLGKPFWWVLKFWGNVVLWIWCCGVVCGLVCCLGGLQGPETEMIVLLWVVILAQVRNDCGCQHWYLLDHLSDIFVDVMLLGTSARFTRLEAQTINHTSIRQKYEQTRSVSGSIFERLENRMSTFEGTQLKPRPLA